MRSTEMLSCARLLLCLIVSPLAFASPAEDPPTYTARVLNPKLTGSFYEPIARRLLIWGTDGTILHSADGVTWSYANTGVDADLTRIAADTGGKVLIAVGERGTILRSEDSGRHWKAIARGTSSFDLRTVIHHAPSSAWIAAGTQGTILRSLDAGKTWESQANPLKLTFEALFVEPVSRHILIGGEEGLIGRSTDGGVSWNLVRIRMQEPVTPITAFHALGEELVATSALGRFLTSTDRGESWQLHSVGSNAFFTDAVVDGKHGTMLMTSHVGDVFRREPRDVAWKKIELVLDGSKRFLSAIRYDAATQSLLAVGHHGLAARSTDGGRRWHKVETGFATSMESLGHMGNGRYVGFGEGGYILTSGDSGRSWRRLAPDLSLNLREVVTLPDSDVAVASGELGGVLRSVDSGQSWETVDIGYPNSNTPPHLRALLVEPGSKVLIAAGAPGTIIRSEDGGRRWNIAHWTPLEKEEAFPWILAEQRQRSLVTIEARGSIYTSNDAGRTWRLSKVTTERELWHGCVLEKASVMIAAGQRGVVARSTDGGKSWLLVDSGADADLFGSYADETSGDLFLLGSGGLILRSTDGGLHWRRAASGTERPLRRMLRDEKSGAFIAFGEHGAIVLSTDDGNSWRAVTSGTDAELRKGLIEPGTGNLVLVGQQGVILRSTDAAKSWHRISSHTRRHFRSAVFNPRNGNLIAVGERIVRLD